MKRSILPLAVTFALLGLGLAACDAEPFPGGTAETESPESVSPLADAITRPADGAAIHLVRLVQRGDSYAFDPAEIEIQAGDVVRFIATGSQPESIAFEAAGGPQSDFVSSQLLDRGVLLTQPGDAYDVSFRDAPAGSYPFVSVPHRDRGMRGTVIVAPSDD